MFLSVIIPVYNVEKYLKKCLDSIVNQSFKDLEVLLINDESTDDSGKLCDAYAAKHNNIQVIHQKNQGLSGARNTGILNAKGKYIWFIDSDDWIDENALEIIHTNLVNNDLEILSFSHINYFEEENKFSEIYNQQIIDTTDGNSFINKIDFFFPSACTLVYKKQFIVDNSLKFKLGIFHEDDYFNLSCFGKVKKVMKIKNGLYFYRRRSNSITTSQTKENIAKRMYSYQQLVDLCNTITNLDKAFLNKKLEAYKNNALHLLDMYMVLKNVSKTSKIEMAQFVKNEIIGNDFVQTSKSVSKKRWLKDKLFKHNLFLYSYFVKLFFNK